MQQSNFIFGALMVAFLVFITAKGSLPVYLSVIFGTADAPDEPQSPSEVEAQKKIDNKEWFFPLG